MPNTLSLSEDDRINLAVQAHDLIQRQVAAQENQAEQLKLMCKEVKRLADGVWKLVVNAGASPKAVEQPRIERRRQTTAEVFGDIKVPQKAAAVVQVAVPNSNTNKPSFTLVMGATPAKVASKKIKVKPKHSAVTQKRKKK